MYLFRWLDKYFMKTKQGRNKEWKRKQESEIDWHVFTKKNKGEREREITCSFDVIFKSWLCIFHPSWEEPIHAKQLCIPCHLSQSLVNFSTIIIWKKLLSIFIWLMFIYRKIYDFNPWLTIDFNIKFLLLCVNHRVRRWEGDEWVSAKKKRVKKERKRISDNWWRLRFIRKTNRLSILKIIF